MTNGFALNHDKSLQIYFLCVKHQAKNDFLKDVESTVTLKTSFTTADTAFYIFLERLRLGISCKLTFMQIFSI